MTPEKCPGCGAKLRPDMLACPNCPLSFPEDDGPTGAVNPLKQSRYYQFLFPVLFFAAVAAGVWYLGAGLMRLGMANNQVESGNLFGEKTKAAVPARASGGAVPGGAGAAPGRDVPPSEAGPADEDGMVVISHLDENGTPIGRGAQGKGSAAARPAPAGKAVAAPRKAVSEWKLRGVVYDLTTLKPLAGCAMAFTDEETNRSIKTRTDSSGRYRAIVPPLRGAGGYSVTIEKNGYAPFYLDPETKSVREMSAAKRKSMAGDLSATLAAAPATVQSASEKPLVTDFYLAPRRAAL